MPVLICFSGLPGVGKTTIGKALGLRLPSTYLRVDVVESALRESVLKIDPCEDVGYLAICAIARSNLKLGNNVIADTVNPLPETRSLWARTAQDAGAELFNVEVVCSDPDTHRARVETRTADIKGHPLPDWDRVQNRDYHVWETPDLRLDSAVLSVDDSVATILRCLRELNSRIQV
ncbi:AAA family ATPase [Hyphomonas atlantica corrig.]|uniref:AAA family ATPase n=1 Tax=Hyphomonas atlantica TaxID=1280948 RepID=UPI0023573265|nr:AAA family ATPase [Hyphomonas atlantica]